MYIANNCYFKKTVLFSLDAYWKFYNFVQVFYKLDNKVVYYEIATCYDKCNLSLITLRFVTCCVVWLLTC